MKRGLSDIITITLIILITIVMISIIWIAVNRFLMQSESQISISSYASSFSIVPGSVLINTDDAHNPIFISFNIKRNSGEDEVAALQIIIEDENGNSITKKIDFTDGFPAYETKKISMLEISNLKLLKKISVVPFFKKDGKEIPSQIYLSRTYNPQNEKIYNQQDENIKTELLSSTYNPQNKNVLCLYNSNSQISSDICTYYLLKRPGAKSLGLAIPDDAFVQLANQPKEIMNGAKFLEHVIRPLYSYLENHPELTLTHLAVAKDIPIKVQDTPENYLRNSANQPNIIFASSQFLLSIKGDYENANTIGKYIAGGKLIEDEGCTKLKDGFISIRNLEYKYTPLTHFAPLSYEKRPYASNPRFAVSFLTGYTLNDIEKMIDKALSPAPNKNDVFWVEDNYASGGFNTPISLVKENLKKAGILPENIVNHGGTNNIPHIFTKPIIGYAGNGNYHTGFNGLWITQKINSDVANRAILTSAESWNGLTFTGDISHINQPESWQGRLADAFDSSAFQGSSYSRSFSVAVGNVHEPTTQGIVSYADLFKSYASGLTFAESVLKAYHPVPADNQGKGMLSVHIAVGDPLMRAFDSEIESGKNLDLSIPLPSEVPITVRECYNYPNNCNINGLSINDGRYICTSNNYEKKARCINGQFKEETNCQNGCSLGFCVGEFFESPNKLNLKKGLTYRITLPIETESSKFTEIFKDAPQNTRILLLRDSSWKTIDLSFHEDLENYNHIELKVGEGFLIKPYLDYALTLQGAAFTQSKPIKIKNTAHQGFSYSLIGIPFCGNLYTASQVLSEIQEINPNCHTISNTAFFYAYSQEEKTWPGLYWTTKTGYIPSGTEQNFEINSYEAYLLTCDGNVDFEWTPSCNPS